MIEDSRQQIPMSLSDIIRRNRDEFEVGLATADELAAVGGSIDADAAVAATLDHWWTVVLRDLAEERYLLLLYGENSATGKLRRTSSVRTLDLERGLARTQNSVYALGERAYGEPPLEMIFDVCAELHRRSLGQRYGVPQVWGKARMTPVQTVAGDRSYNVSISRWEWSVRFERRHLRRQRCNGNAAAGLKAHREAEGERAAAGGQHAPTEEFASPGGAGDVRTHPTVPAVPGCRVQPGRSGAAQDDRQDGRPDGASPLAAGQPAPFQRR